MIHFRQHMLPHSWSRWAASALLLAACGCGTAGRQTAARAPTDPFLKDDAREVAAAEHSPRRGQQSSATIRLRSPVVPVQAEETARIPDSAIERLSGEVRLPEDPNCPCPIIVESPCASARDYPDEYLCDGGDRNLPISHAGDAVQGLETEDTAIEYTDDLDKHHVVPTNKVCVYAPRFGSVSTVSEPMEDIESGRLVQTTKAQLGAGLDNRQGTFAQHQRDATERLITRARGSGVTSGTGAELVEQPVAPESHAHTIYVAEDFAFLKTGLLQQGDEARLATSITAAISLSRDQYPVMSAHNAQGMELRSAFNGQELNGSENRFKGRGKIRIVKLADKSVAVPGDIITFTIRYDNIGDREVHDVVIVDNLTPRLEYVADSAECDVPGRLEEEDNGEGSVILRWVLDEPVPAHKGGVVSFRALVR